MILGEMKAEGHIASIVTYCTLIDGLGKNDRVDDAFLLMKQMSMDGLNPNIVIYGSLMGNLAKVGRIDDIYKLVNDMTMRDCHPNIFVYNALLRGVNKHCKVIESIKIFEQMHCKGCRPDIISYNLHVNSLVMGGYHDEVSSVLEEMIDRDLPPCDIYELFKKIMEKGPIPSSLVLDKLLTLLTKFGELHNACELYNYMMSKSLSPNLPKNLMSLLREGNELVPFTAKRRIKVARRPYKAVCLNPC